MITIAFDTYEFVKELKEAGFSEQQAEVITRLQKSTATATLEQAKHDYQLDDLATKRDLKEMELKLESKIKDTELKIVETKAELIRWVVGVGLLQITIIAGLMFRLTGKM
jgi:hypothetical protein